MVTPRTLIRIRDARRGLIIAGALCLLVAGIAVATIDPFTSHGGSRAVDNGAPSGLATVQRRSLTAQQTLVGTVGYAAAWTVAVPGTTSASDLQQAEQQAASAQAAVATSSASLSSDANALAGAAAAAQAAHLKEVSDCAGANAAVASPAVSDSANAASPASAMSACSSSMQAAQTSQATDDAAREKVTADRAQVASARTTLASAQGVLNAAQSTSTSYGSFGSFTALPAAGHVVSRGQTLYATNGADTLLLYGTTPAWRTFTAGMEAGRDVFELNTNLRALGYGPITGDQFTTATGQAIQALQQAHGLPATGSLTLGSVIFEPGAARVTSVTPTVGQSVQPGPIMSLSSTRHNVSIQLSAAEQSHVRVGNRVLITLPDNSTTPGVVDFVGKVATLAGGGQSATGGGSADAPSLPVSVRFLHPAAAGDLDQAPVNVLITTASVRNALVVPVNALVALAGGGYAIEVVGTSGTHQLVAVNPGLFDDEEGLVQVKGTDVTQGQRVVVPSS